MKTLFTFLLSFFLFFQLSSQTNDDILGIWWNEEQTSKIEILKNNDKYFGIIRYIIPEKYKNGEPPKDDKNPDLSLQNKSLLNLDILKDFVYDSKDNEWENGTIYDPKNGKTYSCYMWLENKNTLRVKGYIIGIRWLGRKTTWTRTDL